MLPHEARDPNWQANDNALYQLFICDNMLVSLIFDKESQRFVFLKSFPTETPFDAVSENAAALFEDVSPDVVNIFLTTPKTALIPSALYDESAQESFFTLNHPLDEGEIIYEQEVSRLKAVMLFAVTEEMQGSFAKAAPEWNLYHADACWLEALQMQRRNSEETYVHVDLQPNVMTLAIYRDNSLVLYNTFECSTPEDRLYFAMFVGEQLRVSPQKDLYFLSGQVHRSDDTYLLFAKYIVHLHTEQRPDYFQYALTFHELPEHFYYKAYCSALCE